METSVVVMTTCCIITGVMTTCYIITGVTIKRIDMNVSNHMKKNILPKVSRKEKQNNGQPSVGRFRDFFPLPLALVVGRILAGKPHAGYCGVNKEQSISLRAIYKQAISAWRGTHL